MWQSIEGSGDCDRSDKHPIISTDRVFNMLSLAITQERSKSVLTEATFSVVLTAIMWPFERYL